MVVSSVVLFSPTTVILQIGATFGIKKELQAGIGAPAFPCGDWASLHSAFPTPLPRGPLHNNRKKLKRAPARPSCFFAPFPRLQKQAFDARYGHKKSPQAMLESFFLLLCGERGIRTPGTVTRTSV